MVASAKTQNKHTGENAKGYVHPFFEFNKIKRNECFSQLPYRDNLSYNSQMTKI